MEKMIAIYYIATGEYCQYCHQFLKTIENFWPQMKKYIVLIGDAELENAKNEYSNIYNIVFHKETHYPWPIIALYKFYLMQLYKVDGVDYHFIFNANTIFNNVQFDWSFFEDTNTIKCTQHVVFDAKRTDYIQSGTVCIPDDLFDKFCNEHVRRVNEYMQKKFIVPKWHDETILNEMLLHDNFLPYKLFPIEQGLRWQCCDKSPYPNNGLCRLIHKTFQDKFKNNYGDINLRNNKR